MTVTETEAYFELSATLMAETVSGLTGDRRCGVKTGRANGPTLRDPGHDGVGRSCDCGGELLRLTGLQGQGSWRQRDSHYGWRTIFRASRRAYGDVELAQGT